MRGTKGEGGERLSSILSKSPEHPELIVLLAGATDGMTWFQQAMPRIFSMQAKERGGMNETMLKVINEALDNREKLGNAGGLFEEMRSDYEHSVANPLKKISTVDHVVSRAHEVREKIFNEVLTSLYVVINANSQDLHDVAGLGGGNRAILIHGHGTESSVTMTDRVVTNEELEKPIERFRALILDTCGGRQTVDQEGMGEGLTEKLYGYNRTATPEDIFNRPLREREFRRKK